MPNTSYLFDIATRQQVLIDRVSAGFVDWSNSQYAQLMIKLRNELTNLSYSDLSSLSKVKLNALIFSLRKLQLQHYSNYNDELIKRLSNFATVHLLLTRRVQSAALSFQLGDDKTFSNSESSEFLEDNADGKNALYPLPYLTGSSAGNEDDGFFKYLLSAIGGASGLSIAQMTINIKTNSIASIENIIRQAWANRKTVSELTALLTGAKSDETGNNAVTKAANGAKGVVFTFVQQMAQAISSGIQSALYNKYVWVAILDSRTSAICRSLNGKVFIFGEGPVPPAHYNCRSHIVAIAGDSDKSPYDDTMSYADWLASQPNDVKKQLGQGSENTPLDIDDYGASDNIILS